MNILIKNISPDIIQRLKGKMPTASLSLIIRALIVHAAEMKDEQFIQIINKQANSEWKAKYPNE